ncbi:hypothetical protein B0H14DRAFT_2334303 [Mycena olivaceomarginata]|nr:hypothetical protein B0H14DRAFT_2334303 [Mycena olivaceomarginata]
MPGRHRHYLIAISADARSLRDLAQQTLELLGQYHCAIAALKHLRDVHIQIACLYIVNRSCRAQSLGPMRAARGTGGNGICS